MGAIKVGLRLGAPKFYDYIRAFGFGQPTGVDLPGESRGMLRRLENWTPVSVGSISMGQEIGVTPLQMITAVSAMANGGLIVRPHVVRALRHGTQLVEPPEPQPRRVIRETTAATMRRMLEGVVLNGTGKLARLDGYTSAGKTGTAQKFDIATGHYSAHNLIASFVGFAPINTPAVTILVQLDSPVGPHEGGMVAAPVFKRIAQQVLAYMDVPHDIPVPAETLRASRGLSTDHDLADVSDFDPAQADANTAIEDPAPLAALGASNRAVSPYCGTGGRTGDSCPATSGQDSARSDRAMHEAGIESRAGWHWNCRGTVSGARSHDSSRQPHHRAICPRRFLAFRGGPEESQLSVKAGPVADNGEIRRKGKSRARRMPPCASRNC